MLVFGTSDARKGWTDLNATTRGPLVCVWEFLTATPQERSTTCYPLEGDLATITREGVAHDQWQVKLPGGARIWYYVEPAKDKKTAGTVVLVRVSTHHPNETK